MPNQRFYRIAIYIYICMYVPGRGPPPLPPQPPPPPVRGGGGWWGGGVVGWWGGGVVGWLGGWVGFRVGSGLVCGGFRVGLGFGLI